MKDTEDFQETPGPVVCDPLIPANEYALKYGITRRTVDRYVRSGKVEKVRQGGRTLIVDKPPEKPETQSESSETVPSDLIVAPVRTDWLRLGYLEAQAKSRTAWQVLAIILLVLNIIILIVGTGAAVWFWQSNINLQSSVANSQNQIVDLQSINSTLKAGVFEANTTNRDNNTAYLAAVGGLKAQHAETVSRLDYRIAELEATNTELSTRIASMSNQIIERPSSDNSASGRP